MADKPIKVRRAKLSEFAPMVDNANAGSERGQYMLEESITHHKAGRSGLAAADGTIIAGNHASQVFGQVIGEDVIVIETTGDEYVIVQRTDIPSGDTIAAQELAIADNRTSEVNMTWDVAVLMRQKENGVDLGRYFVEDEIEIMQRTLSNLPSLEELESRHTIGGDDEPEPENYAVVHAVITPEERNRFMELTEGVTDGERLLHLMSAYEKLL